MTKQDELDFLEEYETSTYHMLPKFIELDRRGRVMFIKKDILKKWFDNHIGKDKACKAKEIGDTLGFSMNGRYVKMRALISSLVVDDHFPIVSCERGYYKANDEYDFLQNIETENQRIQGISRRIEALSIMKNNFLWN